MSSVATFYFNLWIINANAYIYTYVYTGLYIETSWKCAWLGTVIEICSNNDQNLSLT